MNNIHVSVTCTNCGGTVVLNLKPETCGGFCETCYNCSGNVTGLYSVDFNGKVRIYDVKTHGGAKKDKLL